MSKNFDPSFNVSKFNQLYHHNQGLPSRINTKQTGQKRFPKTREAPVSPDKDMLLKVTPTTDNTIITVGPAGDFTGIQDAIDSLGSGNAGFTTIQIDPGTYEEFIYLEGLSAGANQQLRPIPPGYTGLFFNWAQGLQILGDTRPFGPAKTYVNGYENCGNSNYGQDVLGPSYPYFYYPPLGTNFAITQLSHPGGDRSKITIEMIAPLPVSDPYIAIVNPDGSSTPRPPVLENPVLNSEFIGYGAGDHIILADSNVLGNFANFEATIVSIDVSGNTLTIDPPVPLVNAGGVDITQPGANLTLLPNVIIKAPTSNPNQTLSVMTVNNVDFSMSGVRLDSGDGDGSGFPSIGNGLFVRSSTANLNNIVVTDIAGKSTATGRNSFLFGFDIEESDISLRDGWRGDIQSNYIASLGWNNGYHIKASSIQYGNLFGTNAPQYLFELEVGTNILVDTLNAFGNQNFLRPYGVAALDLGISGSGGGVEVYVIDILNIADSWAHGILIYDSHLFVQNPAVRVDRCYNTSGGAECDGGAVYISQGSQFNIYRGFYQGDGVTPNSAIRLASSFTGNVNILPNGAPPPAGFFGSGILPTLPQTAIYVEPNAIFATLGELFFDGNDINYFTLEDGKFSAPYDPASPHNILQVNASGPMNNTFLTQTLLPNAAVITLDPAELCPCGGEFLWYAGKTFLLYSDPDATHCLVIPPGARFIGSLQTFPTGNRVIKFKKRLVINKQCQQCKGAYVRFTVLNENEILVQDYFGVVLVDDCSTPTGC